MASPDLRTPLQPVAMSSDNVAIAEIPPAMRKRLRGFGQAVGFAFGTLVFAGVISAEPAFGQILASRGFDVPATRLILHTLELVALLTLVVLPLVFARLNLLSEVRYRRRHGKWRWEW